MLLTESSLPSASAGASARLCKLLDELELAVGAGGDSNEASDAEGVRHTAAVLCPSQNIV